MRAFVRILAAIALLAGLLTGIAAAADKAGADEVTISQDQLRTGWDPNEPALSPSIVAGPTFGQLFSASVNGQVYAQPLAIGGNLLVATETNHVYSLNAETGAVNWQLSLGPSWPESVIGCGDLQPDIGVTSTPVYDPASGTAYITGGTGRYAHAHGRGGMYGTYNQRNYEVVLQTRGTFSY